MVLLEQSMDVRRIDGKAAATAKHTCHRCYCILAFGSAIALGATDATAIFVVAEPWVRAGTNARSAEAYMELTSTEGATLIGVRCATTSSIEIRRPGTSRASIPELELPAGDKVMLAPHAYRLVLAGLDHPLKLGDRVAIVLIVMAADGSRREIPVDAEVRRRSPTDDHRRGHAH